MAQKLKLLPIDILGVQLKMKYNLRVAPRIHKAAASGDCDRVLRMVQAGCSPSMKNQMDSMNTPLHYAAVLNQPEVSYLLVHLGADIDAIGQNGFTPLGMAVRGGYNFVVQILQNLGADLKSDRFLLPSAVHNLDELTILRLCEAGAVFHQQRDKDKALIDACLTNKPRIISHLLQSGANPMFNPTPYSSLTTYLAEFNCKLENLKIIFNAQLRLMKPETPSPLKNMSKVEQRAIRRRMM